jgi:hypothetical protein
MIKRFAIAALLTAASMGGALAEGTPPTKAQHDEFYKVCMGIADDSALCGCKADAAMTLVDSDFMSVIISSMKGKAPPKDDNVKYGIYITKSNAVCKPGY